MEPTTGSRLDGNLEVHSWSDVLDRGRQETDDIDLPDIDDPADVDAPLEADDEDDRDDDSDDREEKATGPEIELEREGHADIHAERRAFSWRISDPIGLSAVEVHIARVEDGSMKPTTLMRSEKAEGRIDLEELGKGPGLYAALVIAQNAEGEQAAAALRLAYTEFREDCPKNKPWWPTDRD